MQEKILILDFGSQFTQLIARRVRELNIYCEIHPFNKVPEVDESVKGIILSGSPYSVRQEDAPHFDFIKHHGKPCLYLGVCYGAQYIAHFHGGEVLASSTREYGRANLDYIKQDNPLFKDVPKGSQVWMSHADTIATHSLTTLK
jgi:GMP synthase (glutamine-hydrolysing)